MRKDDSRETKKSMKTVVRSNTGRRRPKKDKLCEREKSPVSRINIPRPFLLVFATKNILRSNSFRTISHASLPDILCKLKFYLHRFTFVQLFWWE